MPCSQSSHLWIGDENRCLMYWSQAHGRSCGYSPVLKVTHSAGKRQDQVFGTQKPVSFSMVTLQISCWSASLRWCLSDPVISLQQGENFPIVSTIRQNRPRVLLLCLVFIWENQGNAHSGDGGIGDGAWRSPMAEGFCPSGLEVWEASLGRDLRLSRKQPSKPRTESGNEARV